MIQVRLTIINGQDIRGISAGSYNPERFNAIQAGPMHKIQYNMYLTIKVIYVAEILWEHFGFKKIFHDRVN